MVMASRFAMVRRRDARDNDNDDDYNGEGKEGEEEMKEENRGMKFEEMITRILFLI